MIGVSRTFGGKSSACISRCAERWRVPDLKSCNRGAAGKFSKSLPAGRLRAKRVQKFAGLKRMQSRAGEDEGGDNVRALIQGNRAKFYAGDGRACSEQKKSSASRIFD